MRRVPPAVWLLAPLAVGLLYAAGHALLAPRPNLANLPPDGALLVQRFKNLDQLDRCSFGPRGRGIRAPRELIGSERNLPGLPGVDHTRPVHMILMPRTIRLDSTMAVFGVADRDALEKTFNRPDFVEQGWTRHAQHLVVNGPWAAVAPNRDDARRIGTGGITAADLGEDMAMAIDVPRVIDHATSLARRFPWQGILTALGIDVTAGTMRRDEESGELIVDLPGTERLQRIGATWMTARLWVWMDEKRLRIDLEPKPGAIADLLALWSGQAITDRPVPPPEDAALWAALPGGQSARVLAQLVHHLGVDVPTDMMPFVGGENIRADAARDAVVAWAEPAIGTGYALTFTLAGRSMPPLGDALPMPAQGTARAPLPQGAAPITIGSTLDDRPAPAGEVWTRTVADLAALTFGADAKRAIDRAEAHLAGAGPMAWTPETEDGLQVIARFGANAARAAKIFGRALEPGGVFAALADGDIEGSVSTDGRIVRLEARVVE